MCLFVDTPPPCCPQLVSQWVARCKELEIPISDNVNVVNILADQYEIREWNASGLPRDSVSHQTSGDLSQCAVPLLTIYCTCT